ncbi:MAG: CcoQ/FixQ family Cbb3-type cytochrome c oxidase assembly chaperone [Bacteroidetes bacterium]|nr:CcoQ/FixQ family Cbb3-type cytochrome c oxidase assembly chaperone [Bacteroidota bacterium]
MKFINYLESIAGVSIFPMISLTIFFAFFIGLLIYVAKVNKQHIIELENLPFDDKNDKNNF